MDDDLNVAEAWGALFVLVREANAELDRAGPRVPAADADCVLDAVASIDRVFGVLALADGEGESVSEDRRRWIEEQVAEREAARASGDYGRADEIRSALAEAGVEVEDTASGSRWKLVK
jgi:cysteinyl-tRNA synthetase